MRRVIPLEKKVESKKGIDLLNQTCDYINEHLSEFEEDDYNDLTELCLYLLTGFKKEEINQDFFATILAYIKENIGKIKITFSSADTIHQIRVGSIKMGSLTFKNFSSKEKQDRVEKKLSCCGFYPTMDRKERIFLTFEDRLIMGNQAMIKQADYDNVFIGQYYFNRNNISPSKASLTKLKSISDESIMEDIYEYDESGEKEHYEGILSLEKHRGNEYFVVSSIDRKELFANKYGIRPSNTSSLRVK